MQEYGYIKQMIDRRGVAVRETTYRGWDPGEIGREHRANLARVQFAESEGRPSALICHDEHRVDQELLAVSTGQAWRFLDGPDDNTACDADVLIDMLLSQHHCRTLDFFDGDRTVLSVDARDFRRAVRARPCELARRESPLPYRARMARVVPPSAGAGLKDMRRCLLGISLENENFDVPERLSATLEWIGEMFDECLVIIGDSIHRLTLQIRDPGLGEPDALGIAIKMGRDFLETKRRLFDAHGRSCRFEFLPMSDPPYREAHRDRIDRLRLLHEEDRAYRRIVDDFAGHFVGRQANVAGAEQARLMARSYLLEEAAFCGLMAESGGPSVLVYPGEIKPFQAVSNGEVPDAPEALRKLRLVSLELECQWLPGERPSRVDGAKHRGGDASLASGRSVAPHLELAVR